MNEIGNLHRDLLRGLPLQRLFAGCRQRLRPEPSSRLPGSVWRGPRLCHHYVLAHRAEVVERGLPARLRWLVIAPGSRIRFLASTGFDFSTTCWGGFARSGNSEGIGAATTRIPESPYGVQNRTDSVVSSIHSADWA